MGPSTIPSSGPAQGTQRSQPHLSSRRQYPRSRTYRSEKLATVGEQAFMAIRPKLISVGYRTLNSIPRIHKTSRLQFFCPPLKGVDNQTQGRVTNWIQKLHKIPSLMHSLGLKEAQLQRCPRIKQLQGLKTAQLLDYMYLKTELNTRRQCARGGTQSTHVYPCV